MTVPLHALPVPDAMTAPPPRVDVAPRIGTSAPATQLLRGAEAVPGAPELADEVVLVSRIRRGQLGAPASCSGDAFAREVVGIVRQLAPIRSVASLSACFAREADRSEAVRVAYPVVWLDLGRRLASTTIRHGRHRRVARLIRGGG